MITVVTLHCRAAAREAAWARGRPVGRPKALTLGQERQIRALHAAGEPVPALVATYRVSRATVYRLLAQDGAGQLNGSLN